MGVVSWMVGTADAFLVDAAESQFGAVASNTGTIVLLMVTLSLIGVCINMAFQFRSMDGASFFWYLIKLTLIGLFAFNWANFNAVANAVIGAWTTSLAHWCLRLAAEEPEPHTLPANSTS